MTCHGAPCCPVLLDMTSTAHRTDADTLGAASLLCFVVFYGPPVLFLVIPWLLLGLMLMGPFTLVLTLVAALLAAAALIVGAGALVAMPFLMLRNRRAQPQLAAMGKLVPMSDAATDGPDLRRRGRQPVRAGRGAVTAGARGH